MDTGKEGFQMAHLYIGSIEDGSSTMAANMDRKGGMIMSNRKNTSDMSGGYGDSAVRNLVSGFGQSAVANLVGAYRRGPRVSGKSSLAMSNAKYTSDMVGSINDGPSSLAANRDRKGGSIMSNRHSTSDLVGRDLLYVGAHIGAEEAKAVLDQAKQSNDPAVKHAVAALQIDVRIKSVLKPDFAALYTTATTSKSREHYLASTVRLLLAMVSDTGVSGMVKSVDEAKKQFGELGYLQRAMYRRLVERDDHMKRGWFSRMLGAAEKRTDFDPLK